MIAELKRGDILMSPKLDWKVAVLGVKKYGDIPCLANKKLSQRDKDFMWIDYVIIDVPKSKRNRASLMQEHLDLWDYRIDTEYMMRKQLRRSLYDKTNEEAKQKLPGA
jgi:hypothetical protein